jgi:Uma2 family endonuclease
MAFTEPIGQILSSDEYDALPPNALRELVDGVVQLMATPTPFHQDVVYALRKVLERRLPHDVRLTGEVEIRLDDRHRRNPDLMVVREQGFDRGYPRLRPDQVILAVEVMSPGSESADRVLKPLEYAAAGIEHFWRIELDGTVTVFTFRLDGGRYIQTGAFVSGATVAAPGLEWAVVPVDLLLD